MKAPRLQWPSNLLLACTALLSLAAVASCSAADFEWAYATDMDGSVKPAENCRESLAQSLYRPSNSEFLFRQQRSNVWVYASATATYRIIAFRTLPECTASLETLRTIPSR